MSIKISENQIYVRGNLDYRRAGQDSQVNQEAEKSVFQRDSLEISAEDAEAIRERMKHTVLQSATLFSDTKAGILKEIREEKGSYDDTDVLRACGLSYAKLYSEIEKRHESGKEQYYKIDGTPLTKEDEIRWLDKEYEKEVAWQKANAKVAASREMFLGNLSEMPTEEIENLERELYQAKDIYMCLYREKKGDLTVNWDEVVEPGGKIAAATYVESLLQQYMCAENTIKAYYDSAHQENLSQPSLVDGLNYISVKYTKLGLDLNSPYYRSDMSDAERKMAFEQERAMLLGGRVILGDPYALASSGGVINVKDADRIARQAVRDKLDELRREREIAIDVKNR